MKVKTILNGLIIGAILFIVYLFAGHNYVKFAAEYPEYYLLIMSTTETGPERMDEFKENPAFTDLLQFTRVALGSRQFVLPEGNCPFHFTFLVCCPRDFHSQTDDE